jgi:hypothetical protein
MVAMISGKDLKGNYLEQITVPSKYLAGDKWRPTRSTSVRTPYSHAQIQIVHLHKPARFNLTEYWLESNVFFRSRKP